MPGVSEGTATFSLGRCVRTLLAFAPRRRGHLPAWIAGLWILAASPLGAQTFDPSVTVGAGIQTSYDHDAPTSGTSVDQFALNHARIYLSGTITKNISLMF